MSAAEQLANIAQTLAQGRKPPSVTVREFLSWFGVQRRGYAIVASIRQQLTEHKLSTEPDFESAYIDTILVFVPKGVDRPSTSVGVDAGQKPVPEAADASQANDPIHRISKLAAANKPPLAVKTDTALKEIVTLMLIHHYSQLPVMQNEREVKGMVSWESIGSRLALNKGGKTARDFMEPHHEVREDASIFQIIAEISEHQAVLVRASDKRITGIITVTDLSAQFGQLTEPFLLLSEIENHIRCIINGRFSTEELAQMCNTLDADRSIQTAHDMTFGEYIRLLEEPERWKRLNLAIDRVQFCKQLSEVRQIRNDVMHFDPEGILPEDLETLRRFAQLLQKLSAMRAL